MKEKKKFQMPHIFIILYAIILVIAALSYILPAGEYTRVLDPNTGREIIDPNSYHVIASTPTTVMQLFQAFPSGFDRGRLGCCIDLLRMRWLLHGK